MAANDHVDCIFVVRFARSILYIKDKETTKSMESVQSRRAKLEPNQDYHKRTLSSTARIISQVLKVPGASLAPDLAVHGQVGESENGGPGDQRHLPLVRLLE